MTTPLTYTELLAQLQAAETEDERSWLVVQIALANLSEDLKTLAQIAAIPNWFDQAYLQAIALPDLSANIDFDHLFTELTELSFVEKFSERGFNIHELSRKQLLKHMFKSDEPRFRELSKLAWIYCTTQPQDDLSWHIECLYQGAHTEISSEVTKLAQQSIEWNNSFQFDRTEALLQPLQFSFEQRFLSYSAVGMAKSLSLPRDRNPNRNAVLPVNFPFVLEILTICILWALAAFFMGDLLVWRSPPEDLLLVCLEFAVAGTVIPVILGLITVADYQDVFDTSFKETLYIVRALKIIGALNVFAGMIGLLYIISILLNVTEFMWSVRVWRYIIGIPIFFAVIRAKRIVIDRQRMFSKLHLDKADRLFFFVGITYSSLLASLTYFFYDQLTNTVFVAATMLLLSSSLIWEKYQRSSK